MSSHLGNFNTEEIYLPTYKKDVSQEDVDLLKITFGEEISVVSAGEVAVWVESKKRQKALKKEHSDLLFGHLPQVAFLTQGMHLVENIFALGKDRILCKQAAARLQMQIQLFASTKKRG
eukprot:m.246566 g.246566  ORF g.246566 m.246566 type:complete len:119 (-) comp71243_c0_seq1:92-448(-)